MLAEATVKVRVGDQVIHTASEGDGPVNALDAALRKALTWFYPDVAQVQLTDYKVRILDESAGTESQVRVLIESGDGQHQWRTVGSSENIIEASWLALADSLEYWLLKKSAVQTKPPGVRLTALAAVRENPAHIFPRRGIMTVVAHVGRRWHRVAGLSTLRRLESQL